jgi:hypothetical protein
MMGEKRYFMAHFVAAFLLVGINPHGFLIGLNQPAQVPAAAANTRRAQGLWYIAGKKCKSTIISNVLMNLGETMKL